MEAKTYCMIAIHGSAVQCCRTSLWFNRTLDFAGRLHGEEVGAMRYAKVEAVALSPIPAGLAV
jgi:hypothetical protein